MCACVRQPSQYPYCLLIKPLLMRFTPKEMRGEYSDAEFNLRPLLKASATVHALLAVYLPNYGERREREQRNRTVI